MSYKILGNVLMAVLLTLYLISPIVKDFFEPVPYYQVEQVYVGSAEGYVDVGYSFIKNEGCSIVTFLVESTIAGRTNVVGYEDLDGFTRNFNREPGLQYLNIRVPYGRFKPEKIVLFTRHFCGGTYVNRTFAEIEVP